MDGTENAGGFDLERKLRNSPTFIIKHFWLPVGGGVKPDAEVDWILSFILGDSMGAQIAARIDQTIAKLPGLGWFDRLTRSREEALRKMNAAPYREPAMASGE
jgi:hypothetical protein